MLIEIYDRNGRPQLINTDAIVHVSEASASSHWHGVRSFVKTTDGNTIECGDSVTEITRKIAEAKGGAT